MPPNTYQRLNLNRILAKTWRRYSYVIASLTPRQRRKMRWPMRRQPRLPSAKVSLTLRPHRWGLFLIVPMFLS